MQLKDMEHRQALHTERRRNIELHRDTVREISKIKSLQKAIAIREAALRQEEEEELWKFQVAAAPGSVALCFIIVLFLILFYFYYCHLTGVEAPVSMGAMCVGGHSCASSCFSVAAVGEAPGGGGEAAGAPGADAGDAGGQEDSHPGQGEKAAGAQSHPGSPLPVLAHTIDFDHRTPPFLSPHYCLTAPSLSSVVPPQPH